MAGRDRSGRRRRGRVAPWLLAVAAAAAPAAGEDPIPRSLREGWGFADDIRELGESLAGGYELSERDVDCDGRGEVLLERLALRGAAGNRGYLLFDHGSSGYRYLGEGGAVWAVVDYGAGAGCYLATYRQTGGGRMTLTLTATRDGAFEPLGEVALLAGDPGSDEDRALLAALRSGALTEAALRRLAAGSRLRPVAAPASEPAPPWAERSTVEEVVEEVEGSGARVVERVRPAAVEPAAPGPWWGRVSERVLRQWAATVEERIAAGELDEEAPPWLAAAIPGRLRILASRVERAVRLSRPLGRAPVGLACGRFDAELGSAGSDPARGVEITWAAVFDLDRFGDPQEVLLLLVGAAGDGGEGRVFRLERLTNLDHDRELEAVIEEEGPAGRVQWLLDFSAPGVVGVERLDG